VKKGRDGLNDDGDTEASNTLGKKRAHLGTHMDRDLSLRQMEVCTIYGPGPALLKHCE